MKPPVLALILLFTLPNSNAQNKAKAEWIPEFAAVSPGEAFRTVIRLSIDEGWHTYWENPGEGGLPIAVKADLPEGWTLGEIQFPPPSPFKTGELHGFGYEGLVLFPLTITPPEGSEATMLPDGTVAKVTWLTCNDKSCVPGKAELSLAPADSTLVANAYSALPVEIPGAELFFEESEGDIGFVLRLSTDSDLDPGAMTIFPATRNVLAPSAMPTFEKSKAASNLWKATAPRNEYLEGSPESLTLVLVEKNGKAWTVSTGN